MNSQKLIEAVTSMADQYISLMEKTGEGFSNLAWAFEAIAAASNHGMPNRKTRAFIHEHATTAHEVAAGLAGVMAAAARELKTEHLSAIVAAAQELNGE